LGLSATELLMRVVISSRQRLGGIPASLRHVPAGKDTSNADSAVAELLEVQREVACG